MPELTIGSDYEYILGGNNSGFGDFLNNILNFEAFIGGTFFEGRAEGMGNEIIELAKEYVLAQDIPGPDVSQGIYGDATPHKTILNSFEQNTNSTSVDVYNTAQNTHGQYYAGHVEFGSHPFGKPKYMPPRPFLRPALRTAAVLSRGQLVEDAVATLFSSEIVNRHFGTTRRGKNTLTFGSQSIIGKSRNARGYIQEHLSDSKKLTRFKKGFGAVRPSQTESTARNEGYNTNYVRRTMHWTR